MRARRGREAGLFRGCCMGLVLLLVLLGLAAFLISRAVAAPDLGPPPGGTDDGQTQEAIAATLAVQVAAKLLQGPHAVVTLSEHDLTVIAQARNPHPDRFRSVQVRVRDGLMDVSADTSWGPLGVTVVAFVSVGLDRSSSTPQLVVNVTAVDVGALHVPGWLRDRFVGNFSPSVELNQLFSSSAALEAVRNNLECVVAAPSGVRIGVHRPGTGADAGACAG